MDLQTIDKTASLSKNNSMSLMVFKLVDQNQPLFNQNPFYAMNIFKIKEVLNASEYPITIAQLDASGFFKGVVSVRGDYISVYDTAKWYGYEEHPVTDRSVIIVCEVNSRVIGLLVAYIHGVAERDWKDVHQTDKSSQK